MRSLARGAQRLAAVFDHADRTAISIDAAADDLAQRAIAKDALMLRAA